MNANTPCPKAPRRQPPRLLRPLIRIVTTALILALALAMLPHCTRLIGRLWPDPARTARVSELLRHELTQSARLETLQVDDEGVLSASVQAALIGEVQRVTIEYDYHASIGLDLEKVQVAPAEGGLTLLLPPFEMLSDSLTPTRVDRDDFWYPLTEKRRDQLLTQEREARAAAALEEVNHSEALRQETLSNLRRLVHSWLGAETWLTSVDIRFQETPEITVLPEGSS